MPKKRKTRAIRSPWKSYEVAWSDSDGRQVAPVWEAFRHHRAQAAPAVAKMERVQNVGWPTAREQFYVAGAKRKKAIVRPDDKDPIIWELKCTPHAWRIFFYIFQHAKNESDNRIIYLHASYKTTQERDYGEVITARQRRGPGAGHPSTREFDFCDGALRRSVRPHLGQ